MTRSEHQSRLLALLLGSGVVIGGARLTSCVNDSWRDAYESRPATRMDIHPTPNAVEGSVDEADTLAIRDPLNEPPYSATDVMATAVPATQDFDYESFYADVRRHEGMRTRAYRDSENVLTIGIGFNLEKAGARERIAALGLDYALVCAQKQPLSTAQAEQLMREDVTIAVNDARAYVGESDWSELDPRAQMIVTNMSYNLGLPKLSKFVKLQQALRDEDYLRAAHEMEDSRWYHQTGERARELVEKMRAITR